MKNSELKKKRKKKKTVTETILTTVDSHILHIVDYTLKSSKKSRNNPQRDKRQEL